MSPRWTRWTTESLAKYLSDLDDENFKHIENIKYIESKYMTGNKPTWKTYTMSRAGLVTTITIIVLGIYDLIEVLVNGEGSSISNFLLNTFSVSPMVAYMLGFVSGHLIAPMWPVGEKVYAVLSSKTKKAH